jgi:hypothetical protein
MTDRTAHHRATILEDAAYVAEHIAAVLAALDDYAAGYPTHTPGARPAAGSTPIVDPDDLAHGPQDSTSVERLIINADGGLRARDNFIREREAMVLKLADAAGTIHRLRSALQRIAPLAARPDEAPDPTAGVCAWHARMGMHEPLGARPVDVAVPDLDGDSVDLACCHRCAEYATAEGVLPARLILDAWAQGRRLVPHLAAAGRKASTVRITRNRGTKRSTGSRAAERRDQRLRAERGSGAIDLTA